MKKSSVTVALQAVSTTDFSWDTMYKVARPLTQNLVWRCGVWIGQENDVVEDIVQDAQLHLYLHMQRAEKGEVPPVEHPERMISVIARRCFLDKWRKDRRLVRLDTYDNMSLEHAVQLTAINPENDAVNIVYQTWMFVKAADFVKTKIPDKQRISLLRDLAQRMYFGQTLTPLQQAFADKGMNFRQYAGWNSADIRERSQQAANLSLALVRLRRLGKDSSSR